MFTVVVAKMSRGFFRVLRVKVSGRVRGISGQVYLVGFGTILLAVAVVGYRVGSIELPVYLLNTP